MDVFREDDGSETYGDNSAGGRYENAGIHPWDMDMSTFLHIPLMLLNIYHP